MGKSDFIFELPITNKGSYFSLQMHLDLPLTNLKNPCQEGLESVIVLGKGTFANETLKVLLNHFPSKYYYIQLDPAHIYLAFLI